MGIRLLKIAVIYMQIGVAAGLVMGVLHQFQYSPVHAHIGLLGWASLALAGLIYHFYPEAAQTRLAKVHFWLHNLGLPVFMLGLFLLISGSALAEPFVRVGAVTTFAGLLMFTINVLRTVRLATAPNTTTPAAREFAAHLGEWK
jgi:cbb3-type cytochrome oxidase subunit 1